MPVPTHRPMLDRGVPPRFAARRAPLFAIGWVLLAPPAALASETCQMMACTLVGTPGEDRLRGTEGDDVICGLSGDDVLRGGGGDDLICGGDGADRLHGGGGANVLDGGPGDDLIHSVSANDTIFDTQGRNRIETIDDSPKIFDNSDVPPRRTETSSRTESGYPAMTGGSDGASRLATASTPSPHESTTPAMFTTAAHVVLAPDGSPFDVRGVNIFPWHAADRDITDIIDCWGFNAVRLHSWILPRMTSQWKDHIVYVDQPLIFDPAQTQFRTYDIAPLIDEYTDNGVVVIVDIHDMIGTYFVNADLTDYLIFVEDFVERYADNPYVWLDIHNEPGAWDGTNGDFSAWRTETGTILDAVRAVAPDMMLIVSGTAWGQDTGPRWGGANVVSAESALLANNDLIDDYDNVIRTFHMYDQWNFGQARVEDFVDRLYAADDSPVFVGEYGSWNGSSTLDASTYLHDMVQTPAYEHLGRSVWTWAASDQNDLVTTGDGSGYLIDDCTAPTNLTPLGQLVWDDNHGAP